MILEKFAWKRLRTSRRGVAWRAASKGAGGGRGEVASGALRDEAEQGGAACVEEVACFYANVFSVSHATAKTTLLRRCGG